MIDTDVAIHLRDNSEVVLDRFSDLDGLPLMSVVSLVELEGGVHKDAALAGLRRHGVDILRRRLAILPFDEEAASAYGAIVAALGFSRSRVADRMIAAHALSVGATLVTMNGRDFRDVPGLALEIWPSPP